MAWYDRLKLTPETLADMAWKVGDIVNPAIDNQHWQPASSMIVIHVGTGKRSGMTVITAEDSTGKKFTGFDGSFVRSSKGICKL